MSTSSLITDLDDVIALLAETAGQDGVTLVGVCGFAGAGKTTLCNRIAAALPDVAFRLDCDRFSAFSHPERTRRIDAARASGDPARAEEEENPRNWYDWAAIAMALQSLRAVRAFESDRAWNSENGLLNGRYALSLPPAGPAVVLCDGIFLLHDPVPGWLDLTLLVQANAHMIDERRRRRAGDKADRAKERRDRFERPYFRTHASRADHVVGLRPEGSSAADN